MNPTDRNRRLLQKCRHEKITTKKGYKKRKILLYNCPGKRGLLAAVSFWRSPVQPSAKSKASFKARAGCVGTALLVLSICKKGEAQLPWAPGATADHLGAKKVYFWYPSRFPSLQLAPWPFAVHIWKGSGSFLSRTVLWAQQFQLPCSQPWPATEVFSTLQISGIQSRV